MITNNWEEILPTNIQEFDKVTPKGYIFQVVDISEYSSNNGKGKLWCIKFDFDDNSTFKNYCQRLYEALGRWPNEGTKYLTQQNQGYMKYFIDIIEKSNNVKINVIPGQKLELSQFKGLKFAGQLGYTEYEKDGKVKKGLEIRGFYDVKDVDNIPIPDVKLIDGSFMNYEEYKKKFGEYTKECFQLSMDVDNPNNNQLSSVNVPGSEDDDYPFF